MRRGDPLPQAFQAPVDVHASADGQVYMFRHRQEEPEPSSEDEELNVMELRPRSKESSSQERERVGEMLLLERDISHEDNLSKLALQYGCKVADIKRVNNFFQEQDMYALKSIKIPVKKHGLLTEANSELRNPQERLSPDPASSNSTRAGVSGRPQVQEFTNYLKEVDSDIERLIQSTEPVEEVFSGSSRPSKRWGWRSQRLRSYGADWGIQWWNAVVAMLLIGIVIPIFYVIYFKTQDSGESVGHVNMSMPTSNSTRMSVTSANPGKIMGNHLGQTQV